MKSLPLVVAALALSGCAKIVGDISHKFAPSSSSPVSSVASSAAPLSAETGGAPSRYKIKIGSAKSPYGSLVCIAQADGHFKDEGLDVELDYNGTAMEALESLAQNKIDFATTMMFSYAMSLNQPKKPGRILAEIASGSRDYFFGKLPRSQLR